MEIEHLDHLVLTVADVDRAIRFYVEVLGMKEHAFAPGRKAVSFGRQKINFHQQGAEVDPKARLPTPGSADLCFIGAGSIASLRADLERRGATIELGPVERTGATGPIRSLYLRDPDGNLIEVSSHA